MNRRTFFAHLPIDSYTADDQRRVRLAYWLSKSAHRPQSRDDGERYFEHPRAVTLLLVEYGFTDADTICAGLLHDAVEDTFTPPEVYAVLVGRTVWEWVQTLSKSLPSWDPITGKVFGYSKRKPEEYFAGISQLPPQARAIKCCDRLHNLSTCGEWESSRKRRYVDETRQWILPIAIATDARLHAALLSRVSALQTELDAAQSPPSSP